MFIAPPSMIRTLKVAGADTVAHVFAAQPARLVYFQFPVGSAGTVTILGVGANAALDSDGLVLAAGDVSPAMPCKDLSQFGCQFSNAADSVKVIYAL